MKIYCNAVDLPSVSKNTERRLLHRHEARRHNESRDFNGGEEGPFCSIFYF